MYLGLVYFTGVWYRNTGNTLTACGASPLIAPFPTF
jgi:hypothetical protein